MESGFISAQNDIFKLLDVSRIKLLKYNCNLTESLNSDSIIFFFSSSVSRERTCLAVTINFWHSSLIISELLSLAHLAASACVYSKLEDTSKRHCCSFHISASFCFSFIVRESQRLVPVPRLISALSTNQRAKIILDEIFIWHGRHNYVERKQMHRLDVLGHMLILNTCLQQAFERKKNSDNNNSNRGQLC